MPYSVPTVHKKALPRAQALAVELIEMRAPPADAAAPRAEPRGDAVRVVAAGGLQVAVSAPPAGDGAAGHAGPAAAALRGAPAPCRARGRTVLFCAAAAWRSVSL